MKALQEKKTSLRSILRLGLVAFSLAALVFVACNSGDSDNGGGGNNYGPERAIINMEVIKAPDSYSYEGLPVVLHGIEVLVTYADGSWDILTDHTLFYTEPLPGRISDDPAEWWGTSAASKVPPGYILAEKRQIDYTLCYNPTGREIRRAPLRIRAILDLEEIHFYSLLEKTTYYIDDIVDLSNVTMELKYNTRLGRFFNFGELVGDIELDDGLGTDHREIQPFHPNWDWSLNMPRSTNEMPFLRVNIGNDTNTGAPMGPVAGPNMTPNVFRLVHRDYALDELYIVDKLELTTAPSIPAFFRSDYIVKFSDPWEEWFQEYLQDVVLTVQYRSTVRNPDPIPTKTIVAKPTGPMELPLAQHFAPVPIMFENGVNVTLRDRSRGVPQFSDEYLSIRDIRRADNLIRFVHQNAQRYGEWNRDQSWVRYVDHDQLVKLYFLQTEMIVETTGGDLTWPIRPAQDAGNVDKLLSGITITGSWVYADREGNEEELDAANAAIDPFSPRIGFFRPESMPPVVIDNQIQLDGTGVYDNRPGGYWRPLRETERTITIQYLDRSGTDRATARIGRGEVTVVLTDPDEI